MDNQRSGAWGEILAILIAILFFHSIPKLPYVGTYFDRYPLILFGIAILLLVYRKKIIGLLK